MSVGGTGRRVAAPPPESQPKTIGEIIKAAREKAGLSQTELQDKAKLGAGNWLISRLETGVQEPKESHIAAIAGALEIPMSDLTPNHIPKVEPKKGKAATRFPDLHPKVAASLASYMDRKRGLLGDEIEKRLPVRARGIDPDDPHQPLDDELWDSIVEQIRELWRDPDAS